METIRPHAVLLSTNIPPVLLSPTVATSLVLAVAIAILFLSRDTSKLPHANPRSWFSPMAVSQIDAMKRGMEILSNGKKRFHQSVFRMIHNSGEIIVIPSRLVNDIRNEEGLSFGRFVMTDFQGDTPGFQPFGLVEHRGQVVQNVVRKPLTKLLNSVTEPLASETTFACDVVLGNDTEWKDALIVPTTLDLISRLSSRVFLGDKLCRNEDWLKITKEYTIDVFRVAQKMTLVPEFLRKYIFPIFSAECRTVRAKMQRAQALIRPVIEERRAIKEQARRAGEPIPTYNDAIEWAEAECSGYSYDPAAFQLILSFAAIHTTSDLLTKIMLLLATEPQFIDPLREEMIRVLKQYGWSKNALFNMKLVDSAMKEAQRVMPTEELTMHRIATKDVHLKEDNITIRKGQRTAVESTGTNNAIIENPEKFDIYRWLRMRDSPEFANKAHFVSTSPEHLAFGHGMHACPGRFFAANEIKIALVFLLLNYDWELTPGTTTETISFGLHHITQPDSTLRYRKREPEIDLKTLEFK